MGMYFPNGNNTYGYSVQNYQNTGVFPNFILPPPTANQQASPFTNTNTAMMQQMMQLNQNSFQYAPQQQKQFNTDDTIVIVDDDDDDEVQIVDESLFANGGGFSTGGRIMSTRKISRDETERPVYKLSMHLLKTYKQINNVYYAEKRKREQLLQQQQQQQQQQQLQMIQQQQQAQQQQFLLRQQQQQFLAQQQQMQQQQQLMPYNQPVYNEGYDDENGNYIAQINEELDGRYLVQEMMGKGSFGVVVKAFDRISHEQVAVKIIKNKQQFYNQAKIEIQILQDLNSKDKYNKYNVGMFSFYNY
jgi:hypothetical protein